MTLAPSRPRNDPRQYDDLAGVWWDPHGPFATLHGIAEARGKLIPTHRGGSLLDVGCGAGLLAPHLAGKGYQHIGLDLNAEALRQAGLHGVQIIRGSVSSIPLPDNSVDVVCAGEILEHVDDIEAAVGECCRVLRPGGLLVIDTLADTALSRFVSVTLAERIPGGAPPGIHDPNLFVNRNNLRRLCRNGGVEIQLRGLRPSLRSVLKPPVHMVSMRPTNILFQAWGRKST